MQGKTLVRIFVGAVLALIALFGGVVLIGMLLPEHHRAAARLELSHPPEAVWAAVADLEASAAWRPGVDAVRRLPDEAGRPLYEETGRFGVLRYTVDVVEPPRRLVTRIVESADFGGTWTYVIEPHPSGAALTITEDGQISNPLFRVLTRFVFGYDVTIRDYFAALQRRLAVGRAAEPA